MQAVTLAQVLQNREDRVHLQRELLKTYDCPLISFTMNIAGPIKISPLIRRSFEKGLAFLDALLPPEKVLHRDVRLAVTGCQAMYSVDINAESLKDICIEIEEATPLGRLFDMDVINTDGSKRNRPEAARDSRGCIVCGAPGRGCAAGRLHSVEELQAATRSIIIMYFKTADAEAVASLAVESLIAEVYTTPKPGLVDRNNNGSHQDMDVSTFLSSARALKPYFKECTEIGQRTASLSPEKTFPLLRQAGLSAEQTMFNATGGVNTHKGIIYTIGILCGAIGRLWTPERPFADTNLLLDECSLIAEASVKSDFASADSSTAGIRLYKEQGITGIRGEVSAGLPSVRKISLPAYEAALQSGLSPNHAGAVALLHLIACVTDTNLRHRGGKEGAIYARNAAHSLLSTDPYPSVQQIESLDQAFIARNLSPGGCADLLAVTYFLHKLREEGLSQNQIDLPVFSQE